MVKRIIRMSPAEYINEAGILNQLPSLLKDRGINRPIILTDEIVLEVIKPFLPESFLDDNPTILFTGNCTFQEVERIEKIITDADALIAFGGGQLVDTAKLVADNLSIKSVIVQTVPSNCAAITTKSIVYSEAHEKIANVRHKKAVDLVLLEPGILKTAPRKYLLSGIGDTLAKFYEIRRRITKENENLVSAQIGNEYITICRREMLKVTDIEALDDLALTNLFDTIFLVAASVDGILDQDGRSVIAHAFYNGYVKVKPDYMKTHGEAVALGSLLQTIIEGELSAVYRKEIEDYHAKIGLPLTLKELGLYTDEELDELSNYISKSSDSRVQSVFPSLEAHIVREALEEIRG